MIPNVIHYCWFGNGIKPELVNKCIQSWKIFCPNYDIVEWNESNFDVNSCTFVKEAYKAKKWAFVSDYARLKILYENGGLYLDTDIEIIKPLDDIIKKGGYMGVEEIDLDTGLIRVNPGLGFACEKGNFIISKIMECYEKSRFVQDDGKCYFKTIVDYATDELINQGLKCDSSIQEIGSLCIYPKDFFNPATAYSGKICITDNTYSIHHYMASWVDKSKKRHAKIYRFVQKIIGKQLSEKIRTFVKELL